MNADTIRVVLADDHPLMRMGIRQALEDALEVLIVGAAGDGEEALRLVEELRPDVALLDCRLPGREGAEVAEAIREREVGVLQLLARGYTNARMAKELFIGEQTVKNHVSRIYAKLGVCSRAEAVAWAWEHGVVGEP